MFSRRVKFYESNRYVLKLLPNVIIIRNEEIEIRIIATKRHIWCLNAILSLAVSLKSPISDFKLWQ